MVKEGKLYILASGLKKELLQETYDAKWVGHAGEEMTPSTIGHILLLAKDG